MPDPPRLAGNYAALACACFADLARVHLKVFSANVVLFSGALALLLSLAAPFLRNPPVAQSIGNEPDAPS